MPAFRLIDTHVHLWDPRRLSYSWQTGNPLLSRPYRVEDYRRDSHDIQTEALVFLEGDVDAGQSIAEIDFVQGEAERDPRIVAIVASAPLEHGRSVEPLLAEMVQRFPRVKGVRRILESEAELMLNPSFIEGINLLEQFSLHFEITVNYTQMEAVLEFVKRIDRVPMVLDHCGKPGIRGGDIDSFRRQMTELARHPNVVCKLSGLATEADRANWSDADLRPFIDATLAAFGVDRVMYGSDWPVCLQATSLQRWVQALDRALEDLTETDLRKIYRDNANHFYRLGLESL